MWMRIIVLVLGISSLMPVLAAEEASKEDQVVLITAFNPFAQRMVNGSETVAEALRRDHSDGLAVKVLVLDVVWQEPAAKLPALVSNVRPRLLIGLGEGHPGSVMVERTARNLRLGRDNAGALPSDRLVEAGGPPERHSTLMFNSTWQLSRDIVVTSSDDAGAFLCNALLYTALGLEIPRIGFVHLPPQGEENDKEYSDRFVPIVQEIIRRNL